MRALGRSKHVCYERWQICRSALLRGARAMVSGPAPLCCHRRLVVALRIWLPRVEMGRFDLSHDPFASCAAVPVQAPSKLPSKPQLLWHAARQGFKGRVGQDVTQQSVDIGGAHKRQGQKAGTEGTGCGKREQGLAADGSSDGGPT